MGDIKTDKKTDIITEKKTDINTDKKTEKKTEKKTDKKTEKKTDIKSDEKIEVIDMKINYNTRSTRFEKKRKFNNKGKSKKATSGIIGGLSLALPILLFAVCSAIFGMGGGKIITKDNLLLFVIVFIIIIVIIISNLSRDK